MNFSITDEYADELRKAADAALESMESQGRTVYKCQVCGAWVPKLSYIRTAGVYACFCNRTEE
jgi:hypothetical protein